MICLTLKILVYLDLKYKISSYMTHFMTYTRLSLKRVKANKLNCLYLLFSTTCTRMYVLYILHIPTYSNIIIIHFILYYQHLKLLLLRVY